MPSSQMKCDSNAGKSVNRAPCHPGEYFRQRVRRISACGNPVSQRCGELFCDTSRPFFFAKMIGNNALVFIRECRFDVTFDRRRGILDFCNNN